MFVYLNIWKIKMLGIYLLGETNNLKCIDLIYTDNIYASSLDFLFMGIKIFYADILFTKKKRILFLRGYMCERELKGGKSPSYTNRKIYYQKTHFTKFHKNQ